MEMLDAYIIEWLRKQEEEKRRKEEEGRRIHVPAPIADYFPRDEDIEERDESENPIVIPLNTRNYSCYRK